MVTFGDSESFFGDGPIPEEADGWSTSRISWLVVVSILRGSFNLSSLVVDLEREDIREKEILGYCCMKYVWLIAKNKTKALLFWIGRKVFEMNPPEPTLIHIFWCIGSENLLKLKSFN